MSVESAVAISAILDAHPELGVYGFGPFHPRGESHEQHALKLARERLAALEPRSIEGFENARKWLRRFEKNKRINKRFTSYGLKHRAAHDIGYVTDGMFIMAAIAEGFAVKQQGQSAHFNIRIPRPRRGAVI